MYLEQYISLLSYDIFLERNRFENRMVSYDKGKCIITDAWQKILFNNCSTLPEKAHSCSTSPYKKACICNKDILHDHMTSFNLK